MGALRVLILVTFSTLAASAGAQVTEIYKCVDSKGNRLYTSDKRETSGRKCELVSREVNVVPAQKQPPSSAPSAFPRETPQARASAVPRRDAGAGSRAR